MSRTLAFLFPGQGSQAAGMGKMLAQQFPIAAQVFAEADEALGFKLSTLCFAGPDDELKLTANAQPAIVATSIWSFAAEGSALTRWGSARSPRTTTTQSETRNSMARIILAGIAVYLARGVLSISVITPAAAIATP